MQKTTLLRHAALAAVFASLLAAPAAAQAPAGAPAPTSPAPRTLTLLLTDLWTTATPPGASTASGYLTITNSSGEPDRLVSVSSDLAGTVMLHQMQMTGDVASMKMVDAIDIPAGASVTLNPNGFHLMFVGLTRQLKAGEELPVTLTFARVGRIETYLHVLPLGSRGPNARPAI